MPHRKRHCKLVENARLKKGRNILAYYQEADTYIKTECLTSLLVHSVMLAKDQEGMRAMHTQPMVLKPCRVVEATTFPTGGNNLSY